MSVAVGVNLRNQILTHFSKPQRGDMSCRMGLNDREGCVPPAIKSHRKVQHNLAQGNALGSLTPSPHLAL